MSSAGLVPLIALARAAGLTTLAAEHLTVPTDKGANAGLKVTSLVAGMLTGADSIDDMALLRHGGMSKVFANAYAPSTLGSFLRTFTFGHVRQLDAVASRFVVNLSTRAPLTVPDQRVMVDIDDTIIEVHGHTKQGSGYGYTRVRGLNALIATATTTGTAPVVVAQRLRKGACGSPRGAGTLVRDAVRTTKKLSAPDTRVLLRADSAYFGHPTISAALNAGADVSVTTPQTKTIKAAIATIDQDAWTPIQYTDAIYDDQTKTWISRAEVAEISFTAFAAQKKTNRIPGRLIVRRIPDLNTNRAVVSADQTVQDVLFQTWRFHAFFTTTPTPDQHPEGLDTVAADKTHRAHAIIEQVHADLKNSALAHLPSASFAANSAWLVLAVIAFNLTRAAATIADAGTGAALARATTATIRRKIINIAARIATSARTITVHLPTAWPWETAWQQLFTTTCRPPPTART